MLPACILNSVATMDSLWPSKCLVNVHNTYVLDNDIMALSSTQVIV